MKRLPSVSWCVPVVAAALLDMTGCYKTIHYVPQTQAPMTFRTATLPVLEAEVAERDAAIRSLKATVELTASTGGGKTGKVTEYTALHGYIFVRKPGDLRVLLQKPLLGSSAVDMVSDGKRFTLLINGLTGSRAIVGTNTVSKPSKNGLENLRPAVFMDSLLVPAVSAEEKVLLTESRRVVSSVEGRQKVAIEEPDYNLTIFKETPGEGPRTTRVIKINRVDMLPFEQDIYDDDGRVVTSATYDNYKPFGDLSFPTLITIQRPLDGYALKIEITKLTLNEKFDDIQFELKLPAGIPVETMQ